MTEPGTKAVAALQPADPLDLRRRFQWDLSTLDRVIVKNRAHCHGFLQRFLRHKCLDDAVAVQAVSDFVARAREVTDEAGDRFAEITSGENIPKLVHRIWLTDMDAPSEPPSEYIDRMITESIEYAKRGWQTFFWIQHINLFPGVIAKFRASAAPIAVNIFDKHTSSKASWETHFDALIVDRKFAFAADLLRMNILMQYGGFYFDMGVRFRDIGFMEFIAGNFDYSFILWETMFFQNSFMMMPPNSPISQLYMKIANDPYLLPPSLFYSMDGLEEGMAFSGLLITALLLFCGSDRFRVCPLAPNGEAVEWSSERSWYTRESSGSGKFGGAYVPETKASFLVREGFEISRPHPIFLP